MICKFKDKLLIENLLLIFRFIVIYFIEVFFKNYIFFLDVELDM